MELKTTRSPNPRATTPIAISRDRWTGLAVWECGNLQEKNFSRLIAIFTLTDGGKIQYRFAREKSVSESAQTYDRSELYNFTNYFYNKIRRRNC